MTSTQVFVERKKTVQNTPKRRLADIEAEALDASHHLRKTSQVLSQTIKAAMATMPLKEDHHE